MVSQCKTLQEQQSDAVTGESCKSIKGNKEGDLPLIKIMGSWSFAMVGCAKCHKENTVETMGFKGVYATLTHDGKAADAKCNCTINKHDAHAVYGEHTILHVNTGLTRAEKGQKAVRNVQPGITGLVANTTITEMEHKSAPGTHLLNLGQKSCVENRPKKQYEDDT